MTVKELIAELQKFPAESDVLFEGDAGYCEISEVVPMHDGIDVLLTAK